MDTFDEVVGKFQRLGLTEAQARIAASGHGLNEAQARTVWQAPDPAAEAEQARLAARAGLPPAVRDAATAARQHLSMGEAEARDHAVRLYERENRRAGTTHATQYLRTYAAGLRAPQRAA